MSYNSVLNISSWHKTLLWALLAKEIEHLECLVSETINRLAPSQLKLLQRSLWPDVPGQISVPPFTNG